MNNLDSALEDLREESADNRFMEKIWDEYDRLGPEHYSEEDLEPIPEETLNQLDYKLWKD